MEIFLLPETWLSLLALSFIEIILGVDNLVFIAIVTARLPQAVQKKARRIGLVMAMLMRLVLLGAIVWLAGLTKPLFHLGSHPVSLRDLILFAGGLFLIVKAVQEILSMASQRAEQSRSRRPSSFTRAIVEITLFDILFSLDSVITAVGIVKEYLIMAIAIILAVLVMLLASEPISRFILQNPRIKILALCILLLVGIELVLKGIGLSIGESYLFVAMGFALLVELINLYLDKRRASV